MIPFDLKKYSSGCYDVYNTHTDDKGVFVSDEEFEVVTIKGVSGAVMNSKIFGELYVLPLKCFRLKPKIKYHTVNGVKIPDLRIKKLGSGGELGYFPSIEAKDFYGTCSLGTYLVERGLVYEYTDEGRQAAILHAKALLGKVE